MISLDTIEENFQKILISKDSWDKKNHNLSFLMTQLEKFYNIELLESSTTEEQKNSREFKLYIRGRDPERFKNSHKKFFTCLDG